VAPRVFFSNYIIFRNVEIFTEKNSINKKLGKGKYKWKASIIF
jgi:hypothetical protein